MFLINKRYNAFTLPSYIIVIFVYLSFNSTHIIAQDVKAITNFNAVKIVELGTENILIDVKQKDKILNEKEMGKTGYDKPFSLLKTTGTSRDTSIFYKAQLSPDTSWQDTVSILPGEMNYITSEGHNSPYWGTWFFAPNNPDALLSDWKAGFDKLPEENKVRILGPNYNDYFDNNGTQDSNTEITGIENINHPENDSDTSLPVELTSFSAQQLDDVVKLNWRTESELSNQGFYIERERKIGNKTVLDTLGFVPGQGNSSSGKDYQFIDDKLQGVNRGDTLKYFIRQVDLDGTSEVFGPLRIVYEKGDKFIQKKLTVIDNFPNPFNSVTTVKYSLQTSSNVVITIFDITGKKLISFSENQLPGEQKVKFDLSNYSSGIYILHIVLKLEDKILQSFIHKITLIK